MPVQSDVVEARKRGRRPNVFGQSESEWRACTGKRRCRGLAADKSTGGLRWTGSASGCLISVHRDEGLRARFETRASL